MSKDLQGLLVDPSDAQAGDICGFQVHTKSENSRNSYALTFPVEEFLVACADGSVQLQSFDQICPEKQGAAAMVAMRINLMRMGHMACIQEPLHNMDDQDGALYAQTFVLPNAAILCRDMYQDIMLIDTDNPDDIEDEIALHFSLLRRNCHSQHEKLRWHDVEQRDLALLHPLAPVREDFSDPESPILRLSFQT